MITPTVGRIVWFHPGSGARSRMNVQPPRCGITQPLRADVLYVWDDRTVSLDITDHCGMHHWLERCPLRQEGDPEPKDSYCEWMPYQRAVAKGEIPPAVHAPGSPHVATSSTELDSH